jgi:hypothetical protein
MRPRSLAVLLLAAASGCGQKAENDNAQIPIAVSSTAVADAVAGSETASPTTSAVDNRTFTKEVARPSSLDMVMIYSDHAGAELPLEAWAKDDIEVRRADEFEKANKQKEILDRLRTQEQANTGVGSVVIDTGTEFSEYSSNYQEYYLSALKPGTYFSFSAKDKQVRLEPENTAEAYRWKIAPDEARRILEQNPYRRMRLTLYLKITGARPDQYGGVMTAKITRLIVTNDEGAVFSDRSLK